MGDKIEKKPVPSSATGPNTGSKSFVSNDPPTDELVSFEDALKAVRKARGGTYTTYDKLSTIGDVNTRTWVDNTRDSMFDYIGEGFKLGDTDIGKENSAMEYYKGENQYAVHKIASGAGRVALKVGTEVAKLGVTAGAAAMQAAGALDQDKTALENIFDNSWVKAIDDFSVDVQDEMLPVYVKRSVKEGSFLNEITSVDFWATEGADGIGFMLSMLVPGAALKTLGLGAKVMRGIGAASKMARATQAASKASKFAKLGANAIDIGLITAANTLSEAGIEAASAGNAFESELKHLLDSDEITKDVYDERLKAGKAEVMANTFNANLATLTIPNLIMSNMIWGKGIAKVAGKIAKGGKKIKPYTMPWLKNKGKIVGKALGTNLVSEGFIEEGLQSTAETYYVDKAIKNEKAHLSDLSELAPAYLDMLDTKEGKKAVFLGMMLGGVMTSVKNIKDDIKDEELAEKLRADLSDIESFNAVTLDDVYSTDEDGNTVRDEEKFKNKLEGLENANIISELYTTAVQNGHAETAEALKDHVETELIKNFLDQGAAGIEALEEYLKSGIPTEQIPKQNLPEYTSKIEKIVNEAKYLQEKKSQFNIFGNQFTTLKNEDSKDSHTEGYYRKVTNSFLNSESMLYKSKQRLEANKKELSKILSEKGKSIEEYNEDASLRNELNKDIRVKKLSTAITGNESEIKINQSKVDSFWDWSTDAHQSKFDEYVKASNVFSKEMARAKEIGGVVERINETKTKEEIDAIEDEIKNDPDKKYMLNNKSIISVLNSKREDALKAKNEAYDKKVAEAKKNAAESRKSQKSNDYNEAELYEEGETVEISGETYEIENHDLENEEVEVTNVKTGEKKVFKNKHTISEAPSSTTKVDDSVSINIEGNNNSSTPEPQNGDNNSSVEEVTSDAKIISFDKSKNQIFSWIKAQFSSLLDYESSPRNKVNDKVTFAVNQSSAVMNPSNSGTTKYRAAMDLMQQFRLGKPLSDKSINFIIDFYPLKAIFPSENGSKEVFEGPIEPRPTEGSKQERYNRSTRKLRESIIKGWMDGTPLNEMYSKVTGQNPGGLKIDPTVDGVIPQNKLSELYVMQGMTEDQALKYIKDNIGYADEMGKVEFPGGEVVRLSSNLSGYAFLRVPMMNGQTMPLKLNVKYLSETQARAIFKIYRELAQRPSVKKNNLLSDLNNEILLKEIKSMLKDEIKAIGKPFESLLISDVLDILTYNSTNPDTKIGFEYDEDSNLTFTYGNVSIAKENMFGDTKSEKEFVKWATTNKRHNISIKPPSVNKDGSGKGSKTSSSPSVRTSLEYIKYLVSNKILNTNATVEPGVHTFSNGAANIFIDTNVQEPELTSGSSRASKPSSKSQKESIDIVNGIIADKYTLKSEEKVYEDEKGNKYERQSNVKSDILVEEGLKKEEDENDEFSNFNKAKGATVGNLEDIIGRDVLDGNIKSREEYIKIADKMNKSDNQGMKLNLSEEVFKQIVSHFSKLKADLDIAGMHIVPHDVTLSIKYNQDEKRARGVSGMAGTLDLLVIDKNGDAHIIDFKSMTHKPERTNAQYKNIFITDTYLSKYGDWQAQQTLYKEMLEVYGLKVKSIGIYAAATEYEHDVATNTVTITKVQPMSDVINSSTSKRSFKDKTASYSEGVIDLEPSSMMKDELDKIRDKNEVKTVKKVEDPIKVDDSSSKTDSPGKTVTNGKDLSFAKQIFRKIFKGKKGSELLAKGYIPDGRDKHTIKFSKDGVYYVYSFQSGRLFLAKKAFAKAGDNSNMGTGETIQIASKEAISDPNTIKEVTDYLKNNLTQDQMRIDNENDKNYLKLINGKFNDFVEGIKNGIVTYYNGTQFKSSKPAQPVSKTQQPAPQNGEVEGKVVSASFQNQHTEFHLEIQGNNKPFLLVWNRNNAKPSLWGKKQENGSYTTSDAFPSEQALQKLVDKYVPKNLLNLLNEWTAASKLPVGEVLDAQDEISKRIEAELKSSQPTQQTSEAEAEIDALEKRKRQELRDNKADNNIKFTAIGEVRYTYDGKRVKKIGSNRDKYGRGKDIFEVDGETHFWDWRTERKTSFSSADNIKNPLEIIAKYDDKIAKLKSQPEPQKEKGTILKNKSINPLESQEKVVPLHEKINSEESMEYKEKLEDKIRDEELLPVTEELIEDIAMALLDNGSIRMGPEFDAISKKSAQEQYDYFVNLAKEVNLNIDDLITKCD